MLRGELNFILIVQTERFGDCFFVTSILLLSDDVNRTSC
jgi:hypothetical protein